MGLKTYFILLQGSKSSLTQIVVGEEPSISLMKYC